MKKSIAAITLLTTISSFAFAREVPQTNETLTRVCEKPRSPLYKAKSEFDRLPVEMITDYDALNASGSYNAIPGVVKVTREDKGVEFYPVLFSQRGNSRREYCSAKPFRMMFVKPEIKKQIEDSVAAKNVAATDATYLKTYYDEVSSRSLKPETDIGPTHEGIFKNLGDDVKVVTHCDQAGWEFIGGATEAEQFQRVYSEYTIYKVLENLHMPIETTRLASFTYYKKDGSAAYVNEKGEAAPKAAFFREPPASTAERCGLYSKYDAIPKSTDGSTLTNPYTADPAATAQITLVNKFIFNNDYSTYGQNINTFYEKNGSAVLGAYDFDLSGIIVDRYFKNVGSIEDQLDQLITYVKGENQDYVIPTLKRIVDAKAAMKQTVADSEVNDAMKARFNHWLDLYVSAFENYLASPVTPAVTPAVNPVLPVIPLRPPAAVSADVTSADVTHGAP